MKNQPTNRSITVGRDEEEKAQRERVFSDVHESGIGLILSTIITVIRLDTYSICVCICTMDSGNIPEGEGQQQQEYPAVFISNLQWWTTDVDVETECSQYGRVLNIRFIEDKSCGKSRGMAIVDMDSQDAVQRCIEGMNGKDIHGRQCRVSRQYAKYQQQTPPGGGGGTTAMMMNPSYSNRGGGGMMMGMMNRPPPPQGRPPPPMP